MKNAIVLASDLESQLATLHELASRGVEAADALAEIATDESLPVRVRREAALLLAAQRNEVAFETLVGLLEDPEENMRLAGAQGLGMSGRADALDRLKEAFQTEASPGVGRALLQAMGRIGTPEAVELLLAYLAAGDALEGGQRDTVLATLGGIANGDALAAITNALSATGDPELGCALVTALARIADPRSFDLLLATLQESGHSLTRCAAMQGLGLIGDPRAIPALRVWEGAGSDVERSYAETAIRRIESRAK